MTSGKRIVAQFCGGYVLEDGTVVVEQHRDGTEEEPAMEETQPVPGRTGTVSAGEPAHAPLDPSEKGKNHHLLPGKNIASSPTSG